MTRNAFAAAALGLSLLLAAPVVAQTPAPAPAASHLALARELMDLTNVTQSFSNIYAEFSNETRQRLGVTRPEMAKDMNEVVDSLKPEAERRAAEMTAAATTIFARNMTEADLRDVVVFLKSPVGQRYQQSRAKAVGELFGIMEPWSIQTSNQLFDMFMAEMRKRGHNL